MYTHILIPTDGGPLSDAALAHGAELAKAIGAHVSVVMVATPFLSYLYTPGLGLSEYMDEVNKWTDEILKRADKILTDQHIEHETIKVRHEQPYQAILEMASQNKCDLILMASHGRKGVAAVVLGSETVKVLTHSTIPVLVYRGKA